MTTNEKIETILQRRNVEAAIDAFERDFHTLARYGQKHIRIQEALEAIEGEIKILEDLIG